MGKNKRMTAIIVAGVLLVTAIGVTVAYFAVSVINGTRQNLSATTVESVNLTLDDNDATSFNGQVSFGSTVTRNLKLTNEGGPTKVALYFQDLINTYTTGAFTYTLSYATSENGSYTSVATDVTIPRRSKASSTAKITEIEIPATTTRYYRVVITYNHLETVDQTRDLTATFNTGFMIKAVNDTIAVTPTGDYLKDFCVADANGNCTNTSYSALGNDNISSYSIYAIKTVNSSTPAAGTTYVTNGSPWDVSQAQNGSIMAWVVNEPVYLSAYSTTTNANVLYIGQDGGVVANPNCKNLFSNFSLFSADLTYFDTSFVTDMSYMFSYRGSIGALDLSSFDTSNVTDMSYMFSGCSMLSELNISSFDTSNVVNMESLFYNCSALTTLNLSNFDTSNVINMKWMFSGCSKITQLDLSGFNTSNVVNMVAMFATCNNLEQLDISNFDTANVTDMNSMFASSYSLYTLDVSSFDTSNVTNMMSMFNDDSFTQIHNLTTLDLSSFDTACVTNMTRMFYCKEGLTNLIVNNFDIGNAVYMDSMFAFCKNIKSLNLSNWRTSSINGLSNLFREMNKLEELRLGNMSFEGVTTYGDMLAYTGNSAVNPLKIYVNQNGKSFIDTNFSSYSSNVVLVN